MPLPSDYNWTSSKWNEYEPPTREDIDFDKQEFNAAQELEKDWDWSNADKLGPQGQALPEKAIGWRPDGQADFGTGLQGWWNKAVSNVRSSWLEGYQEGLQISGVTKFAITKTQGEEKGKEILDQMQAERKPENQDQAYTFAAMEATKEVFNQALWGVLDGLSQPAIWAEQALGTAGHSIDRGLGNVTKETLSRDWQASRLAYSQMFDATLYEEMNRRLDAGMRGDLAAQDIMAKNPNTMWPELIGQMVLDPLNVISIWGKAGAQVKMVKKAEKAFTDVANPAILKMLDEVGDIADDAKAYEAISDLVKSQQGLEAAFSHADDIAQAGKDLEAFSNSYKLSSLTSQGKISHVANQTGEILMHIVNNSSPDEALEILRGMVKSASKNADEAAEGLSTMLHFANPKALFSEAGNKTTVMLSKMDELYGAKWLDDIAAMKDDPTQLAKGLFEKLEKATEEVFPSVSSMLKAEDDIKAGKFLSDAKAIEKRAALAERAKSLPEYVKQATRFHDNAQKIVGPINKFFVSAYMGWSPGFAFRNFSNNSLQLLIDYGPGVLLGNVDEMWAKVGRMDGGGALKSLFQSADASFAEAEKLHGGILQGAFSEGGEAAALFPDVRKVGEGTRDTSAKAIVNAVKNTFKDGIIEGAKKGPVLAASQIAEANAAKRIIAKTYRKTFDNGVKAMVKAVTPQLREVGFGEDIIKKLPTLIAQHDGDAAKVIGALRDEIATGTIDLFNDITRIDPKHKAFLSDVGKWDEYAEKVLQAPTREEAQKAAQKIFDDIAEAGDYVYREGRPAVSIEDKFLKMAEEQGGLPPNRGQLVSLRETENRKVIGAAEAILAEADDMGAKMGLDVGSMKKTRGIQEISGWGSEAAKEAKRIRDITWKVTRESKKTGADLPKLWSMLTADSMPTGLDTYSFRDALWAKYDEVISKNWAGARDLAIDNVGKYLDDLKAAGAQIPDAWKDTIKTAQEGAQQYDNAMIGRFGELVEETPMAYGTRSTQIRGIANKYGVATTAKEVDEVGGVVRQGADLDKKTLAIINKYAETTYKSLEEVPISVAEEAFAKKAGKEVAKTNLSPGLQKIVDDANAEIAKIEAGREARIAKVKVESLDDGGAVITFPDGSKNQLTPEQVKKYGDVEGVKTATIEAQNKVIDSDIEHERAAIRQVQSEETAKFNEAGDIVEPRKRILPPPTDGEVPPISRAIHEQKDEIKNMRAWMMDDIGKNYGKKQVTNRLAESALQKAERELGQKLAETRLISSRVAQANRDFTLFNYGEKSYWDVALAYLYPFHFWHGRNYASWTQRIASNPAILGHYARYKQILGTVHADMPEWWRYNLNTNDLPGIEVDNPMYFNLEATLWPLNGITGTDFNDKSKRTNWWTYTLDFANKFGPSTWSPISIMTGLALYNKGEEEAGLKWMGRLIPQSATVKAVASKFGIGNLEVDPIVKIFGENDLDPYEQRRVSRALAAMEQEVLRGELPYTQEQIQDAAYSQSGEIWDQAVKRAVSGRSGSQISSYLFGVGFKGRTEEDKEVDQYYSDYSKLYTMRANLSPEEFREGMDALKRKYPFADTMLLSSKDSESRDSGLAYLVMARVPPGQSSQIAKAVGIDSALFDKFYASKGNMQDWSPADRQKFMAGVLTMAAVLEIPDDMSRAEWTQAKNAYSKMSTEAKGKFGEDINDSVDAYYALKAQNRDKANDYLDDHPELEQYFNWKSERIMGSPLLSSYYGGASQIENYYRGKMNTAIESELGAEIFDVISEYNDLKTFGESGEAKAFYNQNKAAIKKYYDLRDSWGILINQQTARLSAQLPEAQGTGIREDVDVTSPSAQNLVNELQPEEQPTFEDFQAQIPESTLNLVQDYFNNSEPLPESARKQLDRLAKEMGYYSSDDLLQAIGTSMYQGQQ